MLVPYTLDGLPDTVMTTLAARRPDLEDPAELVPRGWAALVATVEAFVAAGTSKFVVLPDRRAGQRGRLGPITWPRRPRCCCPSRPDPRPGGQPAAAPSKAASQVRTFSPIVGTW